MAKVPFITLLPSVTLAGMFSISTLLMSAQAETIDNYSDNHQEPVKNQILNPQLSSEYPKNQNFEKDNQDFDNVESPIVYVEKPSRLNNQHSSNMVPTNYEVARSIDNVETGVRKLDKITDPTTGIVIEDTFQVDVPEKISLFQAQQALSMVSPKLASNEAAIMANKFQAEATEDFNKPLLFMRAGATRYRVDADIDLTGIKADINNSVEDAVNDGLNDVGISVPNIDIPPIISGRIPDNYDFKREESNISAGLAMLWPVYTAGRTEAINALADARTYESKADALLDNDELQTTLIDRYFTAQLALIVSYLRDDALNTVQQTHHMAQRLFDEGFVSRVEVLEAQQALAEAESESIKAQNDAKLAMTALQRLLRTQKQVKPTTPLFMSSTPLPPLEEFQNLALNNHPGLKKVDAKYLQAQSLANLSDTGFKPTVSVFGYHEIDNDPSWIAGVSASWKLWGGLNRQAQTASGEAQMRQAMLSKIEVSDNILLLVEKNWQSVENARVRYLSLDSNVQLASELLRLKQLGMQEGLNTALEVTTAQTQYLKARTEQAAAAKDYVQALAELSESIGSPEIFNDYMASADIKLASVY